METFLRILAALVIVGLIAVAALISARRSIAGTAARGADVLRGCFSFASLGCDEYLLELS